MDDSAIFFQQPENGWAQKLSVQKTEPSLSFGPTGFRSARQAEKIAATFYDVSPAWS